MQTCCALKRMTRAALVCAALAWGAGHGAARVLAAAEPEAKKGEEKGERMGPQADQAIPGQRLLTCGHSFHTWVCDIITEMAKAADIKGHEQCFVSYIGHSRAIDHAEILNGKNEPGLALFAGKIDVVSLSAMWVPDEGIEKFARVGFEHNPNIRVTVQEFWLPLDRWDPTEQTASKPVDHNAATVAELRKQHEPYIQGMEDYFRAVNKKLGKDVLYAVPVGQAVIALREKIIAGQAPGVKTQAALFGDSWGHAGGIGVIQALSAYCHFAVFYRRNPAGLPAPAVLANVKAPEKEELNKLLQKLAWEAVLADPLSGVKAEAAAAPSASGPKK